MLGDDNTYKCFPDISEEITNGKLLIRRRIDYNKIITNLKDLRKPLNNDDIYYSNGKIIDINIYCNSDISEMENQTYNTQILKYINAQRKYYEEFVELMKPLIEKNKGKYSSNLLYTYNRFKMLLDNKKCTYQGNSFDNFVIEFTILEEKPVNIGSKITGRYGKQILFKI